MTYNPKDWYKAIIEMDHGSPWPTICGCFFTLSILWMVFCILIPRQVFIPVPEIPVLWFWLLNIVIFSVDGIAIGYLITGHRLGIFIDHYNKMSLSRVQVGLWTVIILSTLFTLFVIRFRYGVPDPINISISPELWAVMGISLGSFAGRTAITGKKLAQKTLRVNGAINDASLLDLFKIDEKEKNIADIGKIQMFFFTIITLVPYTYAIFTMLLHTGIGSITGFPPLTDGIVAVLGISHAGLLANSGVTRVPV